MAKQQKTSGPPGPGWYRHPTMANTMGYWDGQQWTGQFMPAQPTSNSGPTAWTIARGVVGGLVFFSILGGILYSCSQAEREDNYRECLMDNIDNLGGYQKDCDELYGD